MEDESTTITGTEITEYRIPDCSISWRESL